MGLLKIIADESIPFLKGVLEPYAEIKYMQGNLIRQEHLLNADALLIRTRTICNESLLKDTTVKFIATATIGFDHIDTDYCKRKDIYWTNSPGCNSSSVQQYIIAALLTIAQENDYKLDDMTLGIVGVGNVGSKVNVTGQQLGLKVLLNDPPRARNEGYSPFVSLDKILLYSDIISLHVPLIIDGDDKTFHLFNDSTFSKIKQGTLIINTSRGEVIGTDAIKTAITKSQIRKPILDVWENEPGINLELLHDTLISTPHIAGYSMDGKANGTAQLINSLSDFFHLPLSGFYPGNIPQPESPIINIDGKDKSCLQIVHEAVKHCYPIMKDHASLQISPHSFEQLRCNYPLRREFQAYTVYLRNCRIEAYEILKNLGFNTIID